MSPGDPPVIRPGSPDDAPRTTGEVNVEATHRLIEAVVDADERMRRRLDFTSEAIFETDLDGRLVYVNRTWSDLTGCSQEVSLGRHLAGRFVESDRAAVGHLVGRARVGGRITARLTRRDGSTVWVQVSARPFDGGGALGAITDISDERATRDELSMLSAVARVAQSPVLVTDASGTIEWVNAAFEARTGYTRAEAVGHRPGALLQGPESDVRSIGRIRDAIRAGRPVAEEMINYTKSGEAYWAFLQITPVVDPDGAVTRFVGLQTETTERRRYEQEILDHATGLEARVVARTAELARATEDAEAAVLAQGMFLATMSHEIRTSLNAISGLTRLALGTNLDARQRDYVVKTDRAARNLMRIVNDVLDYSKIEADALELEQAPVDLGRLLGDVDTVVGSLARAKGIDFAIDNVAGSGAGLVGDALRIEQILLNLGGNAVKFTDAGGVRLGVRVAGATPETVTLEFCVSDTGIGLQPEEIDRLFDAFSQANSSTSRRFGGTGLGLAISKRLVQRMGGTISVASIPDEGTTFVVAVPMARAAGTSAAAPALAIERVRARLSGARVLVVDDDPFGQQVMRETLTGVGARVTVARTGAEALARIDAGDVLDIVLMDVQLPDIDGIEVARRLRADARAVGLIIIAMTASAESQVREACLGVGMDDFVAKPVDPDRLYATMARWLPDRDLALAPIVPAPVDGAPPASTPGSAAGVQPTAMSEMLRADPAELRRMAATSIAPVDSGGLLAILNGDEAQLRRLNALFVSTGATTLGRIDEAWGRHDLVALSHLVHPLKASAATVGAAPLAALCRDIESACQDGDLAGAERALSRLRPAFERVASGLDASRGGG